MPISAQLERAQESAEGERLIVLGDGTKAKDRPDFKGRLWRDQQDDVKFVRDVLGGTKTLRAEGETYLPRHKAEEGDAYDRRKKASVFFNATSRTLEGLTGMIHRKDLVFDSETPPPDEIAEDAENIDLRGRSLSGFSKDVTRNAIADGHTFVLVEFPRTDGGFNSRAEERAAGVRPYWINLKKQEVINLRWEIVNGEPRLTLAVYVEETTEPDGVFGESSHTRYRVLRPGSFEVWERERNQSGQDFFRIVDEGNVSLTRIPLFPVYAKREGIFRSTPPLLDLAYENVGHYQVRSDHRYALSFASVPVPVFMGFDPETIEWGPDRTVATEVPEGKAKILESSGTALEQSREELRDIEGRMAFLGLQMLADRGVPGAGDATATARLLDKAESDSALATTARSVQDGLNRALEAHAEFRNLGEAPTVEVNTDFQTMTMSPRMVQALSDTVEAGNLSLETMWDILVAGEILPEDFDPEMERERIQVTGPMTDLLALTEAGQRSPEEEPPLPEEEA